MKRVVAIGLFASFVVACGGASKYAEPPASPAAAPAPSAPGGYPEQVQAEKGAAGEAAPSTASAPPPASAPSPSPAPQATARDEAATRSTSDEGARQLAAAERDVESRDCSTACRALGSMERAIVLICATAQDDGDAGRCTDAKGRLVSSRKKVRASCGSCPDGTSVDPSAPVPSRR